MEKVFAQNPVPLNNTIGGPGLGPVGAKAGSLTGSGALDAIASVVSSVIGFMTIAAGIWFIFQFLIGGYTWLSSMGDKHRLEEARNRIVNALIGLVIVVGGWGILALVGQFFGIDFLINNSGTIMNNLIIK
jgi:hypothetical protein